MTDAEFRMFSELLRRHCGLHFGSDTRFLLEKRLLRRMRQLDVGSFAAYHYLLRNDCEGELANLIDDLTTNETYFFRERNQLRALVEEIFVELRNERLASGNEAPISVWSAGCSSGEEPFSVVMLAQQAGLEPGVDLRVYASDISRRMLSKARKGLYREASFRETEAPLRDRYFTAKDGHWRISDDVKQHVDFIHLNLLDRSKIALLGKMDVILCRNVIIYFDGDCKRSVIELFADKLRPGGHLLLGHSESLMNVSASLELRHLRNDMVYRKPRSSHADRWHSAASAALYRADGDADESDAEER